MSYALNSDESFSKLTKDELLSLDFLSEIYSTDDDVLLSVYINTLEDRARELRCLSQFKRVVKALDKDRKTSAKKQATVDSYSQENELPEIANQTNYPDGLKSDFETLNTGSWIANKHGIRKYSSTGEIVASYFPVLPICYFQNVNNNVEKVMIAFYKGKKWNYRVLYRSEISSVQEMIKKSNYGFPTTSKTASALIDFLQEVEALNEGVIPIKKSTTKMGWHRTQNSMEFMPYSDEFAFDGDNDYHDLYNSIHSEGDFDKWLEEVKKVRKTKRFEPLFFMAASFASPLLELVGVQSFAVDLWGSTEGGKTVSTLLATSIWADPREGKYYGNFQSTETAFEIKQGFLNNLPLFIDDSSNVKDKDRFNYSTFIYNRCNEKGKSRSNIARGIELEYTWRHIILMTGEQPFTTEQSQGGAINRTLEITAEATPMYEDPEKLVEVVEANFGFAGEMFINCIKAMTPYKLKERYKKNLAKVKELDRMKKQSNALAVILTADELSEEFIFKDGIRLSVIEAAKVLTDKSTVSEDIRCYEYLLQQVNIFSDKFKPIAIDKDTDLAVYKNDCWGISDEKNDVVYIMKSAFDKLCVTGGYSPKRFLDWAGKNGKIRLDSKGNYTIPKWYSFGCARSVCLVLNTAPESDTSQFSTDDPLTEGVPF